MIHFTPGILCIQLTEDLKALYRWHNGMSTNATAGLLPGQRFHAAEFADGAMRSMSADDAKALWSLARLGCAEEVGALVAFLASPRASWVSGACVTVDGCQSRSNI